MGPEVSLIFPTHNRKTILRTLLAHLGTLSGPDHEGPDHEVIVIDDASTDGTSEMLRLEFPAVRVLRNEVARGFEALPDAIAMARGEFVFQLDDDAYPAEATLRRVVAHFRERGPQLALVALPFVEPKSERTSYTPYFPALSKGQRYAPTRGFHAGAVAFRRAAARQIPPSPAGYFMYETEPPTVIEYLAKGWEADYLPGAPVYHLWDARGAKVKVRAAYLPLRNDLVTIRRYYRGWRKAEMLAGRYLTGLIHLTAAGQPGALLRAVREADAMLLERPPRHIPDHILERVYPCFDGLTLTTFWSETNRRRVGWFLGFTPIDQTC